MSTSKNPRIESEAQVIDSTLIISVKASTIAFAALHSPYFFLCSETGSRIKITDEDLFLKSVRLALNREDEDGSTPITRMLDKAFQYVCDQGMDGIEANIL